MEEQSNQHSEQSQKDLKVKNVNLTQFTLFTQSAKNPDKSLRMSFGVSGTGFPFVNADADEEIAERTKENNFGKLTARLGGAVFYSLMNMVQMAKSKEPGWKMGLQNFHTFVNGKKMDKPAHVNDLLVGVDQEGCVWISLIENGRDSARFFFGPGDWHNWKKADGSIASRKEMNHFAVDAWVKGLSMTVASTMAVMSAHGTVSDEKFIENKEAAQAGGGQRQWPKRDNYQGGDRGSNGGGQWNRSNNSNWKGNNNYQKGGYNRGGGNWQGRNQGGQGSSNGQWQGRSNQSSGQWRSGQNNWQQNRDRDQVSSNRHDQDDRRGGDDSDFDDIPL